jgi:predicted ArsR family transcriptional regulator
VARQRDRRLTPARKETTEWAALGLLADPVRRAVYEHVPRSGRTTAAELATTVGVSPALAGHHVRKLVAAGLVEKVSGVADGTEGRPPSGYRRATSVQVPGRRPELLTDLLVAAARPDPRRLRAAARGRGRQAVGPAGSSRNRARSAMDSLGFMTRWRRGDLDAGSCPFSADLLAHPQVACDVALALAQGVAAGLPGIQAERVAGSACCVRLRSTATDG